MKDRQEVFVIEVLTDGRGWVPMGSYGCDDRTLHQGIASAYKIRKDAQKASNFVSWGRSRHRITRYIPKESA